MEKQCAICGSLKLLSEFHLKTKSKDGRQPRCKECANRVTLEYSARNAARDFEPDLDALKRCPQCAETKVGSEFNRNRRNKDGLASECRACSRVNGCEYKRRDPDAAKARNAADYAKHRDARLAQQAEYIASNRDRISERGRAYYLANKEKIKAKTANRYVEKNDEVRAYRERFRVEQPEKLRAQESRIRAKRVAAPGSHTADDIKRLMTLQRGLCIACRCDIRKAFHVDHIQALARGGSNDRTNLQLLCERCNKSKHARHPVDFMQTKGFLL